MPAHLVQQSSISGADGLLLALVGRGHIATSSLLRLLEHFNLTLCHGKLDSHTVLGLGAVDAEHVILEFVVGGGGAGFAQGYHQLGDHVAQLIRGGAIDLVEGE